MKRFPGNPLLNYLSGKMMNHGSTVFHTATFSLKHCSSSHVCNQYQLAQYLIFLLVLTVLGTIGPFGEFSEAVTAVQQIKTGNVCVSLVLSEKCRDSSLPPQAVYSMSAGDKFVAAAQ
jgi:hypothetical protein